MLRIQAPLVVASMMFIRSTPSAPEVHLGNTTLVGSSFPDLHQEFFGGIPFASPPVGNLRLSPPVIQYNIDSPTFNATQFGAACPAINGNVPVDSRPRSPNVSEDCLNINIFRPEGIDANSRLPIMAWVYGGGFYEGSADMYNGSAIVAQSITRGTPTIFVSFNYRLGPLGFPQGAEAEKRGALNLGLKDILAALSWTQKNIEVFGGDKSKVTVFGVSAGSISISQLLLDPSFENLARAAIMHSGSSASAPLFNATHREQDWQLFTSSVPECADASTNNTFDCLRIASIDSIVNASNVVYAAALEEFPFVPVIDGPNGLINELPSQIYASGSYAKLPFIAGTCLDEGPVFIPSDFNSTERMREWLSFNTTPSAVSPTEQAQVIDRLIQLYPDVPALGSPFGTGNNTFGLSSQYKRIAAAFADLAFSTLRRALTQTASGQGVKTFGYLFTDPQPENPPLFGVAHGSDIPYVFGSTTNGPSATILSHNMIDYWVSFANTLDPNDNNGNTSRPQWAQYTPQSKIVMQLDGGDLKMIPDTYREQQIAFMIANPLALRH